MLDILGSQLKSVKQQEFKDLQDYSSGMFVGIWVCTLLNVAVVYLAILHYIIF